ncbi:MAG: ferritin-like domain-containing protein [Gammaproteobacteria bacterium]
MLSTVASIRRRARKDINEGAITPSYPADKATIVRLLNEALATELVCVLRDKRHYYVTKGIRAKVAATEFLEHAAEEQQHADWLAERIVQLGEDPDFNPGTLTARSHAEYHDGTRLNDMLQADLVAERIAIESYREAITYVGDRDPTTRRLLETILASEEHHAEDLVDLLADSATS